MLTVAHPSQRDGVDRAQSDLHTPSKVPMRYPGKIFAAFCMLISSGLTHANGADRNPAADSPLSTRCIGRYLIDLPSALQPASGGQTIEGVTLNIKTATAAEFKKALDARTTALKAASTSRQGVRYPILRTMLPLSASSDGVMFDAAEPESVSGRVARLLEVITWRNGYLIRAELEATDTTFPEEKDNETLHAHVKTDVTEKTRLLLDVVSRTSGRADHEIPTEQGACIINGFVKGAATSGEFIRAGYEFARVDHFSLYILSTSLSRGKNTILDRIEKTRPMIERANGKEFRKTKRNVDGMNGYEVAYTMPNDMDAELKNMMADQFIFELNSAEGSKRKPRLSIEGHNGVMLRDYPNNDDGAEPVASVTRRRGAALSTAAVERMWDKIIPTIRARPNAF